jgi:hypothetical protein
VFLQYLLGFKRLGWHVLFLDQLRVGTSDGADGRYLAEVMRAFGLGDSFSLAVEGRGVLGLPRREVLERVGRSALLVNVMGFLSDAEILAAAPRRVFLDIDPGFGQMWRELGLADVFKGHDDFVTIGRNVGRPGCGVPTCGLKWVTTPQPVVLARWPVAPPEGGGGGAFTSVASWRGPFGPIEYRGKTYGLRVHEFRRFADLPRRTGRRFELALDIHPDETRDLALLDENGWVRVDPRAVAGTPHQYQAYVAGSTAEFMVAKNLYVQTGGGWFSDRSTCYLATGRPVLAQDTGLKELYPTGEGLITFTTPEEAAAGVEAIDRDYARHSRAARAIAEEFFDSDKVLTRLLKELNL